MNGIPKLDFFPPEFMGDGVQVDVANTAPQNKTLSPFKASKITISPGVWSPLDQHEVKECWLIASGQGLLVYNETEQEIGVGDMLFYDSMQSHKVYNNGDEDLLIFSLWWDK